MSVLLRPLFGRQGFVVDGTVRRSVRGFVEIPDATGRVHKLRVRGFPLDPCPRIEVDGVVVDVFPRLPTWQTALCTVPVLLMFLGGAVGGLLGALASYGNFRIARSRLPAVGRVAFGAVLTAAACALTLGVGVLIVSLTH